jgi:hypothetical protein
VRRIVAERDPDGDGQAVAKDLARLVLFAAEGVIA